MKTQLDESNPEGMANRAADYNLLYNVGMVLAHQQGVMTMGELARALDVPFSTATRTVDWLVRGGYAERQSDPDDRRVVHVALTERGQATYQVGTIFMRRRLRKLLCRLTPEECEKLVVLLRKLVQALEEEL